MWQVLKGKNDHHERDRKSKDTIAKTNYPRQLRGLMVGFLHVLPLPVLSVYCTRSEMLSSPLESKKCSTALRVRKVADSCLFPTEVSPPGSCICSERYVCQGTRRLWWTVAYTVS